MVLTFFKKPDGTMCALALEAGTVFSADEIDDLDVSGDVSRIRFILEKMTKDQIFSMVGRLGFRPSNKSATKQNTIDSFLNQWETIYNRAQMISTVQATQKSSSSSTAQTTTTNTYAGKAHRLDDEDDAPVSLKKPWSVCLSSKGALEQIDGKDYKPNDTEEWTERDQTALDTLQKLNNNPMGMKVDSDKLRELEAKKKKIEAQAAGEDDARYIKMMTEAMGKPEVSKDDDEPLSDDGSPRSCGSITDYIDLPLSYLNDPSDFSSDESNHGELEEHQTVWLQVDEFKGRNLFLLRNVSTSTTTEEIKVKILREIARRASGSSDKPTLTIQDFVLQCGCVKMEDDDEISTFLEEGQEKLRVVLLLVLRGGGVQRGGPKRTKKLQQTKAKLDTVSSLASSTLSPQSTLIQRCENVFVQFRDNSNEDFLATLVSQWSKEQVELFNEITKGGEKRLQESVLSQVAPLFAPPIAELHSMTESYNSVISALNSAFVHCYTVCFYNDGHYDHQLQILVNMRSKELQRMTQLEEDFKKKFNVGMTD